MTSQNCIECGATRSGPYCVQCGLRFMDERLSFRWLGIILFQRILNMEGGFLRTFWDLMKGPGKVASSYIKGYRSRYVNPITYLLVGGAVSLFFFNVLGSSLEQQFLETSKAVHSHLMTEKQMSVFLGLQKKQFGYTTQIYLVIAVFFAFLLRLFFWRTAYNLAETFVFVAYVFGHILLLDTVFVPLILAASKDLTIHLAFTKMVFVFVTAMGSWGFYGKKVWPLIKVLAALAISLISVQVAIQTALIAYVIATQ